MLPIRWLIPIIALLFIATLLPLGFNATSISQKERALPAGPLANKLQDRPEITATIASRGLTAPKAEILADHANESSPAIFGSSLNASGSKVGGASGITQPPDQSTTGSVSAQSAATVASVSKTSVQAKRKAQKRRRATAAWTANRQSFDAFGSAQWKHNAGGTNRQPIRQVPPPNFTPN